MNQSELKELLHYDPDTGVFIWLINHDRWLGKVAGCADNRYRRIKIKGKKYRAHRVAWLYITGEWPKDQIDHINGNGHDNRFVNLREATYRENTRNKAIFRSNTSGHHGVERSANGQKWRASISFDGRRRHLGLFSDKNDAIKARKAAEKANNYHPNHGRGIVAL